ncbi:HDOD domain-containing protein [Thalassotalea agariperforans]
MKAVEYAEKASDIFVLSDSFIRIKELVDNESSTIDDIADVILIDPALSASVLKLANSSIFNYPGKIDTISKAVLVLGITEVYTLVIAYFATDAFKSLSTDADYLEEFWERSVDCALLLKYLGERLNMPNTERLFLTGLLHNIGELVVKQFLPEQLPLCAITRPNNLFVGKQKAIFDFTFGECSAELLKLWQLPFSIIEPIRYQDDNTPLMSGESKLLYIAKRLMIRNLLFENTEIESFVPLELLVDLNITDDLLEDAKAFCNMERFSILSILKPSAMMVY